METAALLSPLQRFRKEVSTFSSQILRKVSSLFAAVGGSKLSDMR